VTNLRNEKEKEKKRRKMGTTSGTKTSQNLNFFFPNLQDFY